MIKIENTVTPSVEQWKSIILGMRNPMDSWDKSDSDFDNFKIENFKIGDKDHDLMMQLSNAGTDHRKFMRMITVYADVTAPLYWWKEMDTYSVGVVKNSCSTMHRIHAKGFTLDDFSTEHLFEDSIVALQNVIYEMNRHRQNYNFEKDKDYWWQIIQLLPTSYNQKRTVCLNYEVLANIYHGRRGHKLDEWYAFREWIEELPYSEVITQRTER